MTPREKAHNLICKFYFALPNNGLSDSGINSTSERWKEAEKCALIAVDEIMNICPFIKIEFATSEGGKESDAKEYWQEVKQEI
jgi:hypothetical protein